ncbi:N-acetyl sugar amidotransferase [Geomonas sp. Red69]|uniref:N-acetyl sugar amidotransferase n=1 Tax=Geomonas diazotrophica TaxID=2843197 RepID=A0ABX8JH21_9BACT|nr:MULTISPECIES: N-acetyl sugar amidotransferase [Geomonas]MBU5636080.1 N-acetyl sugar amidotransferase [Geomonas diazotrophica]QWV95982.1 N-acetyl sugar amidotransferase [Geomonas nitrogeniifigens]QXE85049.1 N-acetyl sugar amidotransferase [Geomonas nitrogeniifigens]
MILNTNLDEAGIQICSRCIYDERVSSISFDDDGVCNYCRQVESLKEQFGTGTALGNEKFSRILDEIRSAGKGKQYDCIIGVSGGTDSSYLVYMAKEWGLRPLAVHYDNTWNSAIATQNIRKVLSAFDVDLHTHVINNKEGDDIFKAFFYAGVPEIEASTDLGYAETMYRAAAKYGVKHVLEGHSFLAEGITPVGKNYFDGEYIRSIHRMYGRVPMQTYPLMTFERFLWRACVARIKMIRPFWYIQYSKEEARAFLEKKCGWEYYGGHHLENRMTAFFHGIYAPQKFGADFRNNSLSALVRKGAMSRKDAWAEYNTPPKIEDELLTYFKKRLGLSDDEYERIMQQPPKSWKDYPTYKKRFERLRPFFALLVKANLVGMSFYLKYCFPAQETK